MVIAGFEDVVAGIIARCGDAQHERYGAWAHVGVARAEQKQKQREERKGKQKKRKRGKRNGPEIKEMDFGPRSFAGKSKL